MVKKIAGFIVFNLHKFISSLVKPEKGKEAFSSGQNKLIIDTGMVKARSETITTVTNLSIFKKTEDNSN
ncbi:hypothetical protein OA066_01085 [SAR86 cluster bacterium]|nr:hypothetical protein [SAR86 cluster bacterium]|tara:strand:+ start:510 stop:716 length:207 start_codon:yes stop_codon:yes gene_type:complete